MSDYFFCLSFVLIRADPSMVYESLLERLANEENQ